MKRSYRTAQKTYLLAFLRSNSSRQLSIEEIAISMDSTLAPGKSTLYRLMHSLVEEGLVRRFARDHSRQFVYQLMDGEQCNAHFHLQCVDCGRLVHLDQGATDELQSKILSQHQFLIDGGKTMLYGHCIHCAEVPY